MCCLGSGLLVNESPSETPGSAAQAQAVTPTQKAVVQIVVLVTKDVNKPLVPKFVAELLKDDQGNLAEDLRLDLPCFRFMDASPVRASRTWPT